MSTRRPTPPWLFAFTGTPYGVVGSFTGGIMPYLTRSAEIPVKDIGLFVTLLFVPTFFQFLYAPIVDFGPRRKHWFVIVTVAGAGALVAAMAMPLPGQLDLFLAFAFMAQLLTGLVGACNGGLMVTTIPDHRRGAAGAWLNVGNLCGGGIIAAGAVYLLSEEWEPAIVGLMLAGAMIAPALAVLTVDEPPRERLHSAGEVFGNLLRDVRRVLLSRAGATGLLLCMSPVGTAALINYWSALAADYVRPELLDQMAGLDPAAAKKLLNSEAGKLVAWVTGPPGVGLTAVGALVGGYLCDRTNRRAMYLLAGALTALCGIAMALSPPSKMTFMVGALVYALISGFCYSAFTATVLETIGSSATAASTRYSMYVAAGNLAIAYVGLVDTRFASEAHVEHVVWSDAALNLGGVVILFLVFWRLGSFGKWRHAAAGAEDGTGAGAIGDGPGATGAKGAVD